MESGMNMMNVTTKVGTTKIVAKFMTTLDAVRMPEPDFVRDAIKKEFNHNLTLWESIQLIRNELRPYCYEVVITPQLKGLSYSYEIIKK